MLEVTYRIKGYRSKWVVKVKLKSDVKKNLTNNRGAFISTEGKSPTFDYFNVKRISK